MRYALSEIVDMARRAGSEQDAARVLQKHDSAALRMLLRYAYDPRIQWLLPEGDPPYKPLHKDEHIGAEHLLLKEVRTMYLFVSGGPDHNPNVSMRRREALFIDLLEHCLPADAELLLRVKDRAIPGLPSQVVRAAFPGLLPDAGIVERAKEVVATVASAIKPKPKGEDPEKVRARRERAKIRAREHRAKLRAEREARAAAERERQDAVLQPPAQEDR